MGNKFETIAITWRHSATGQCGNHPCAWGARQQPLCEAPRGAGGGGGGVLTLNASVFRSLISHLSETGPPFLSLTEPLRSDACSVCLSYYIPYIYIRIICLDISPFEPIVHLPEKQLPLFSATTERSVTTFSLPHFDCSHVAIDQASSSSTRSNPILFLCGLEAHNPEQVCVLVSVP